MSSRLGWHGKTEAAQARDTAAAAAELRTLGSSTVVLGGASIYEVAELEVPRAERGEGPST